MLFTLPCRAFRPLILQIGIAMLIVATIAVVPPANGAILVISLGRETPGGIARWAIANDARLLGPGPLPNSLVVMGSRSRLFGAALAHHGLLVAGYSAGCGGRS